MNGPTVPARTAMQTNLVRNLRTIGSERPAMEAWRRSGEDNLMDHQYGIYPSAFQKQACPSYKTGDRTIRHLLDRRVPTAVALGRGESR